MPITLESIRLTESDLQDYRPYLSSAQQIYSPSSPKAPACLIGWRDRWWLQGKPRQNLAINYWLFESEEDARIAVEEGRTRLSSRSVMINGKREPIYQPYADPTKIFNGLAWQADNNFLFSTYDIAVLVREYGKQVPVETTLSIAKKVLEKIVSR